MVSSQSTSKYPSGHMSGPLLLIFVAAALGDETAQASNVTLYRREMTSAGCTACCFQNDCRLGYMMTSPGVCCGQHPRSQEAQCCPLGSTCVRCMLRWKCSNSRYITRQAMCNICSDNMPPECYNTYHSSGGFQIMGLVLPILLLCCVLALCYYQRPGFGDQDVVVVGQPQGYTTAGQPVYAQPVYAQQGCVCSPSSLCVCDLAGPILCVWPGYLRWRRCAGGFSADALTSRSQMAVQVSRLEQQQVLLAECW